MELRTAPKWFELLPETHRKKALKNLKTVKSTKLFPSLIEAIGQSFIWDETPQGYGFWKDVFVKLQNGKIKLKEDVTETKTAK